MTHRVDNTNTNKAQVRECLKHYISTYGEDDHVRRYVERYALNQGNETVREHLDAIKEEIIEDKRRKMK